MFDLDRSLLPPARSRQGLRAVVAGLAEDLAEISSLLQTLGLQVAASLEAKPRLVRAGTYLGKGKIEEIKHRAQAEEVDAVILDYDLSPKQLRNLEKLLGIPTLDRSGVILEIFSRHARSREAKVQVELAKLQYLLPRLAHYWSHFERQRGGNVGVRGMGEKQIEVDRRLLKKRIVGMKRQLEKVEKERSVQRSARRDILKVAFIGYTNAGKSTLLNALTDSAVVAEDKLFATLDASVRALDPRSHPPVVAIDTVGFIRRIPPALVASFRSTLEELREADLLVHVVDASSPSAKEEMVVTEETLQHLGVEGKPRLVVMNKIDLVENQQMPKALAPGCVLLSALDKKETSLLKQRILEYFRAGLEVWEVVIPYGDGRTESKLREKGAVEVSRFMDKGTYFRVRIAGAVARKLGLDRFKP